MDSDASISADNGLGGMSKSLSVTDYVERLEKQLCLLDGFATHGSSGKQRQCPKCKTRWSYHHRRIEFRCLEGYSMGLSAINVATMIPCAKNTALKHYRRCGEAMELLIAELLEKEKIGIRPITKNDLISLEKSLRKDKKRLRNRACYHLFMHSLTADERLRLLFEKTVDAALFGMRIGHDIELDIGGIDGHLPSDDSSNLPRRVLCSIGLPSLRIENASDDDRVSLCEYQQVPFHWRKAFKKLQKLISSQSEGAECPP